MSSVKKFLAGVAVTAVMVGCASTTRPVDVKGIPQDKYLVGSGTTVEFTAPEAGIVYVVVEGKEKKGMVTKSLKSGEAFSFGKASDPAELTEQLEQVTGMQLKASRLLVYFVPQEEFAMPAERVKAPEPEKK